jgi:CrcB protein
MVTRLTMVMLVSVGGGAGCAARFLAGAAVAAWLPRIASSFPFATLGVNVVGCTLAGALLAWLTPAAADHPVRLLLMTGFLGGLTTFSAFAVETLDLLDRSPALGFASMALNVLLSLAGAWGGMMVVRAIVL